MKQFQKNVLNVPGTDMQEVKNAMEVINTKLVPFLEVLTEEEIKALSKMKDKTLPFVVKTYEHYKQHSWMLPSYVEQDSFNRQYELLQELREMFAAVKKLEKGLSDTAMVLGSDLYSTSRSAYDIVKNAEKRNVPGAKVIYDDLKKRFAGNGNRKSKKKDNPASDDLQEAV